MTHDALLLVRVAGELATAAGSVLLGREQRVTVGRGLCARPAFIVLWVALAVVGIVAAVASILAS